MKTERRGVLHTGIQEAVELGCINGYKLEDALKQRSPLPEITLKLSQFWQSDSLCLPKLECLGNPTLRDTLRTSKTWDTGGI